MRRFRYAVAFAAVVSIACVSIAVGASPPGASTGAATSTGPSTETLRGAVNPNGAATTYYFEYGVSSNYGNKTPATPASAGSGTKPVDVSADLTGLSPGTVYHFRLVAHNASGTNNTADRTFTANQSTSQVRVMGREGFVSPGGVIGVELGCFNGTTTCSGHITMSHLGTVVGQRFYSIPPESGGFHNMGLTQKGRALLRHNSVFHLLGVNVTVNDSTGQTLSYIIHLARWVWH